MSDSTAPQPSEPQGPGPIDKAQVLVEIALGADGKFQARVTSEFADSGMGNLINGAATAMAACYNVAKLQDPGVDYITFVAAVATAAARPEQNGSARVQFQLPDGTMTDPVGYGEAQVPGTRD